MASTQQIWESIAALEEMCRRKPASASHFKSQIAKLKAMLQTMGEDPNKPQGQTSSQSTQSQQANTSSGQKQSQQTNQSQSSQKQVDPPMNCGFTEEEWKMFHEAIHNICELNPSLANSIDHFYRVGSSRYQYVFGMRESGYIDTFKQTHQTFIELTKILPDNVKIIGLYILLNIQKNLGIAEKEDLDQERDVKREVMRIITELANEVARKRSEGKSKQKSERNKNTEQLDRRQTFLLMTALVIRSESNVDTINKYKTLRVDQLNLTLNDMMPDLAERYNDLGRSQGIIKLVATPKNLRTIYEIFGNWTMANDDKLTVEGVLRGELTVDVSFLSRLVTQLFLNVDESDPRYDRKNSSQNTGQKKTSSGKQQEAKDSDKWKYDSKSDPGPRISDDEIKKYDGIIRKIKRQTHSDRITKLGADAKKECLNIFQVVGNIVSDCKKRDRPLGRNQANLIDELSKRADELNPLK